MISTVSGKAVSSTAAVRFNFAEYQHLCELAERHEIRLSEVIRALVRLGLKHVDADAENDLAEIGRLGS